LQKILLAEHCMPFRRTQRSHCRQWQTI
jgi:hypothetical protein